MFFKISEGTIAR